MGYLHQKIAGHFRTDRRMGSIAASLLPLASHQPTVYLVTDTSPHDVIPASLIYKEAGLVLLNLQGKPWKTTDTTMIACPPISEKPPPQPLQIILPKQATPVPTFSNTTFPSILDTLY